VITTPLQTSLPSARCMQGWVKLSTPIFRQCAGTIKAACRGDKQPSLNKQAIRLTKKQRRPLACNHSNKFPTNHFSTLLNIDRSSTAVQNMRIT